MAEAYGGMDKGEGGRRVGVGGVVSAGAGGEVGEEGGVREEDPAALREEDAGQRGRGAWRG